MDFRIFGQSLQPFELSFIIPELRGKPGGIAARNPDRQKFSGFQDGVIVRRGLERPG